MADLITATRSQVANNAAQKAHPTAFNRPRSINIDTPPVWTAALNDTAGTALVLPAGSRLLPVVELSNAVGAAGSTLSVGLRDAVTKVAIDATAIMAATSIAADQTIGVRTGTKASSGQFYTTPVDAEVYLTFGGAAPLANQAIHIELEFVSP